MATALVRLECANDTWSTVRPQERHHDGVKVESVPQAFLARIAVGKSLGLYRERPGAERSGRGRVVGPGRSRYGDLRYAVHQAYGD